MRVNFVNVCVVLLISATSSLMADSKTAKEVFDENRMAVVHVVMRADPSAPSQEPSSGTGFIIGGDGFVLTAKHVVSGYINATRTPITVRIGSLDGSEVAAEPIPFDIGLDASILRLRNPIGVGLTAYRVVERGDSKKASIGDNLFIVGFNLSSNISVFQATLSSDFGGGIGGNLLWNVGAPGALFGMSGAPVFDTKGQVVGIVKGGQPGTSIVQVYPEFLLENLAIIAEWKRAPLPAQGSSSMAGSLHPVAGNTIVMDGGVNYGQSGFSFAKNQTVSWDSPDADILVATSGQADAEFFLPYDVPPYSSPHDAGAHSGIHQVEVADLASVTSCSRSDYDTHWAKAQLGGVYCVRLRSGSAFGKIKVTGVYKDRISFDWALL